MSDGILGTPNPLKRKSHSYTAILVRSEPRLTTFQITFIIPLNRLFKPLFGFVLTSATSRTNTLPLYLLADLHSNHFLNRTGTYYSYRTNQTSWNLPTLSLAYMGGVEAASDRSDSWHDYLSVLGWWYWVVTVRPAIVHRPPLTGRGINPS